MLWAPLAIFLSLLAPASAFALAGDTSLRVVQAKFDAFKIPTDVHIQFNPTTLLEVTFPEPNAKPTHVKAGVQLPRNVTAGPPTFGILHTPATARLGRGPFVVAAVDPDAPTPQEPTVAQIRHFLGGGFTLARPDARGFAALTNSTPAVSGFLQPTPPAGSDAHRYVFLLFKQPPGFANQTLVTPTTSIQGFNISTFAEAVGLENPLGGTFIRVAPDPSEA